MPEPQATSGDSPSHATHSLPSISSLISAMAEATHSPSHTVPTVSSVTSPIHTASATSKPAPKPFHWSIGNVAALVALVLFTSGCVIAIIIWYVKRWRRRRRLPDPAGSKGFTFTTESDTTREPLAPSRNVKLSPQPYRPFSFMDTIDEDDLELGPAVDAPETISPPSYSYEHAKAVKMQRRSVHVVGEVDRPLLQNADDTDCPPTSSSLVPEAPRAADASSRRNRTPPPQPPPYSAEITGPSARMSTEGASLAPIRTPPRSRQSLRRKPLPIPDLFRSSNSASSTEPREQSSHSQQNRRPSQVYEGGSRSGVVAQREIGPSNTPPRLKLRESLQDIMRRALIFE